MTYMTYLEKIIEEMKTELDKNEKMQTGRDYHAYRQGVRFGLDYVLLMMRAATTTEKQ